MSHENILYDYLGIEKEETAEEDFPILTSESTKEDYKKALHFLIEMNRNFYVKNGVILYVINDYLIDFNKVLSLVIPLFEYAKENDNSSWKHYLGDYLLRCQFSLISELYEKLDGREELLNKFYSNFNRGSFYLNGELLQYSLNYYNELKDNYEFETLKYRIMKIDTFMPVLYERAKRKDQYHQLFDYCLKNLNNSYSLIKYDYDTSSHKREYINDLENRLKQNSVDYLYVLKLLRALNFGIFSKKEYVKVLNVLINDINQFVKSIKEEQESIIYATAKVDDFLSILRYFKNEQLFYSEYSTKINECIQRVLYAKRVLIKNTDYTKSFQSFNISITNEIYTAAHETISSNYKYLLGWLVNDYDELLEEEIKLHSENPIYNLASHKNIIQEQGVYRNADEIEKHTISEYYNCLGKKIVDKLSGQLLNVYSNDYYLMLIRAMSLRHDLALNLVYEANDKQFEKNFVDYLLDNVVDIKNDDLKNEYIMCVAMILLCEQTIFEVMDLLGLNKDKKMSENINRIFEQKENDSDFRNIIVYVNYILYSEKGMNLRNDIMHGNLIHGKVTKELVCIFTCFLGLIKLRGKLSND